MTPNDLQMNGLRRKERCHNNRLPETLINSVYIVSLGMLLFCCSCTSTKYTAYNPASKIPACKLKEDFTLLKKILEANHPSLYWYTPKDSVDFHFNQVMESINDSLTESEFKKKVAWFVSTIRCGHTAVRPSSGFEHYNAIHKTARFPLMIKTWSDSLILLGSLNKEDSLLKRGTIITSIENVDNRCLLDSMFKLISTDGQGNNFKSQAISFNFPVYYGLAFGLKDSFSIRYIDSAGIEKQTYVRLYKPEPDTLRQEVKQMAEAKGPRPSRKQIRRIVLMSKRSILFDSANHLAYMRLATFSGGKLRSFFRESFKEMRENNVRNLVIDLRENSGGNINMSLLLSRYMKDKPFHAADTAAAVNRQLPYGKYIQPAFPYRMAMRFITKKEDDDKFHFRQLEQHYYKPYTNDHFNNRIYIIQGGYTFSAAAMFVLQLKGQQNVTVLGEETGGGNYGTSAVHLPDIVLPNSKVRVTLPLYRLVFDHTQIHDGKGIQPDIYVPPSSVYIRNGVDPKLEKVKELIETEEKAKVHR